MSESQQQTPGSEDLGELRARWEAFTTTELHAIVRGFDMAEFESLLDETGPDRALWRSAWDVIDSRGGWAGWTGAERP